MFFDYTIYKIVFLLRKYICFYRKVLQSKIAGNPCMHGLPKSQDWHRNSRKGEIGPCMQPFFE